MPDDLKSWITKEESQGYTEPEIMEYLQKEGYTLKEISEALSKHNPEYFSIKDYLLKLNIVFIFFMAASYLVFKDHLDSGIFFFSLLFVMFSLNIAIKKSIMMRNHPHLYNLMIFAVSFFYLLWQFIYDTTLLLLGLILVLYSLRLYLKKKTQPVTRYLNLIISLIIAAPAAFIVLYLFNLGVNITLNLFLLSLSFFFGITSFILFAMIFMQFLNKKTLGVAMIYKKIANISLTVAVLVFLICFSLAYFAVFRVSIQMNEGYAKQIESYLGSEKQRAIERFQEIFDGTPFPLVYSSGELFYLDELMLEDTILDLNSIKEIHYGCNADLTCRKNSVSLQGLQLEEGDYMGFASEEKIYIIPESFLEKSHPYFEFEDTKLRGLELIEELEKQYEEVTEKARSYQEKKVDFRYVVSMGVIEDSKESLFLITRIGLTFLKLITYSSYIEEGWPFLKDAEQGDLDSYIELTKNNIIKKKEFLDRYMPSGDGALFFTTEGIDVFGSYFQDYVDDLSSGYKELKAEFEIDIYEVMLKDESKMSKLLRMRIMEKQLDRGILNIVEYSSTYGQEAMALNIIEVCLLTENTECMLKAANSKNLPELLELEKKITGEYIVSENPVELSNVKTIYLGTNKKNLDISVDEKQCKVIYPNKTTSEKIIPFTVYFKHACTGFDIMLGDEKITISVV